MWHQAISTQGPSRSGPKKSSPEVSAHIRLGCRESVCFSTYYLLVRCSHVTLSKRLQLFKWPLVNNYEDILFLNAFYELKY
jgi:hypothetical protein